MSQLPDEITYYPPVITVDSRTDMSTLFEYLHGESIREASVTTATDLPLLSVSAETKAFWKANAGNAKARRRWRRRNIPNSQRVADAFHRHLMTQGTNPGGPRLEGLTLIGPDGEDVLP